MKQSVEGPAALNRAADDRSLAVLVIYDMVDETDQLEEMHKQAAQWSRGEPTLGSQLANKVRVQGNHGMTAQGIEVPRPMDGVVDRVTEWILDTGASYNLIDVRDVVLPTERLRKALHPKCVTSANGLITLDTVVDTLIPALQ